jgi:hypothetical protein
MTRNALRRTEPVRRVINSKRKQKRRSQNRQEEAGDGYGPSRPKRVSNRGREPSLTRTETAPVPVPVPTVRHLPRVTKDHVYTDIDYAGGILFVLPSPELSPEEREDESMTRGIYGHLFEFHRICDVPWAHGPEYESFLEYCNGELADYFKRDAF